VGVRSALASRLIQVGKSWGGKEPPEMSAAAENVSQMTFQHPFAPGEPVGPFDGYSRHPRAFNFETGYNIATRPRTHERVSFDTLRGLIESYDVAQLCLWHRIDSIRSLDWKLLSADHYAGDVTGAIKVGMAALDKPDRIHGFKTWLARWLYDVLAYDAGTLYRLRNRAGRCIGLSVPDGTTFAPLLDYWGNPPQDPAEAFVQYVNGLPWNWLTRSDLVYEPFRPRPNSPYGHAALEAIILNANTDIRFQVYFLERFTKGNVPEAFASAPETWNPDQIEQFQDYWDSFMFGDQSRKHQIRWMPGGSTIAWTNEKDFTDQFSLHLMRKTCLDEATEILTRRGWVHFPKLADGDEVATRSPDGRFEWQQPTDYIAEPHSGDMVQFKSSSLDLLATPEHRMLLTYFPTKKYPRPPEFIRTAAEIVGKGGYMIPMRSRWEGRSPENFVVPGVSYDVRDRGGKSSHTVVRPDIVIPIRTWLAFLGLWLTEGHVDGSKGGARKSARGHTHRVGISQTPESRYFGEIQELLDSLPFNWTQNGHTWVCQDKRLHAYLAPMGNSREKFIPEDIKDLSPELLEVLWAWACKGDGHHYLGKFWQMITASARLADDWQEVLQKCGRDASVSFRKGANGGVIRGKEVTGSRGTWIVRERTSPLRTAHGEIVQYEGMVYCVTVPNGVIYVRRNGRPAWVGNCAAFHVVPTDLGFTDNANYSTGESQADVQHRVGDLPMMCHIEEVLTRFLYDDLGLPLQFTFDRGEDQDDRVNQAQADAVYVEHGVVSASELREMRFGLTEPEGQVVPRVFFTARAGPIPLSALYAVAGPTDPQTAAPDPHAHLPEEVFAEIQGVVPNPPIEALPLAEEEFGPKALPPAPPAQPPAGPVQQAKLPPAPVAKEDAGAGITSETGITSYDLDGRDEDEDDRIRAKLAAAFPKGYVTEDEARARAREAVAKEMSAFRRFAKSRQRAGTWRDFEFSAVGKVQAHNLNDAGRLAVRKAAGEIAVAGLAVKAADTGRVLMLQRALSDDDAAAGLWEFPGGGLEDGETPLQGAWREWAEETGCIPPPGEQTGSWAASNGIYEGIVWTIPAEAMVPVRSGTEVTNPDDPDGDQVEAIAWWEPAQIPGNPAMRPEILADADAVLAALGCAAPCEPDAAVAKAIQKSKADEVFHQLTEDYPKAALGWVHHTAWDGPQVIPFARLDMDDRARWRASHEPARVAEFAARIRKRLGKGKDQLKKPAVVVFEPGRRKGIIIDGHHRTLGAEKAGEPGVLAWVGHVDSRGGPWMELHDLQFTRDSGSAPHAGDDDAASQVGKAASGYDLSPRSGMISLDLPDGLIEPVPGGVDDFHVTVVYLGPDVGDDAFAAACDRARDAAAMLDGPLSGTVSGIGAFPPSGGSDGKVPAWAAVALPGAERLREALADLSASEHKDWMPHVTLAYVDEGDPLPDPLDPVPVTFTHLSVHRGDDVARFPLGGEDVAKAAGPPKAGFDPERLTGLPALVQGRRERLERKHRKAAAAAWDASVGSLDARALVASFRQDAAGQDDPSAVREAAIAAAAAWLEQVYASAGFPALLGALTDAMGDGLAEGEADAAVLAPGGKTPDAAAAFTAALAALDGSPDPGNRAADTLAVIIAGAAADAGRALAQSHEDGDDSETGLLAAVKGALAGLTSRALGSWLVNSLRAAFGAGAVALWSRAQAAGDTVLIDWVTDGNPCSACEDNEAGSPYASGDVPDYPGHPNCMCYLASDSGLGSVLASLLS